MDIGARAEIARGPRRRSATLVVAATVAVIAIGVTATVALSSRGGTVTRAGAPRGGAALAAPTKLQTAVEWVDGLVAGRILSSDVTSRLDTQDPAMAAVVRAAWGDLRSSGSRARLRQARFERHTMAGMRRVEDRGKGGRCRRHVSPPDYRAPTASSSMRICRALRH